MTMDGVNPEIGKNVAAAGRATNYLEAGSGDPVVLIHGSGPGVTAYANWRLTIPALAGHFHVVAPDIAGFGFTDASVDETFDLDLWVPHVIAFMDALGIKAAHVAGNSFGGALALALAIRHPERVRRLVLMGAVGVEFELTEGLDAVWGYRPGEENMRRLIEYFAFDTSLISDEIVRSRYQASLRPGIQEMYAGMFPAPRQRHIARFAAPEADVRAIDRETLIVHGRDDRVIPVKAAIRLNQLIPRSQLHVFGRCGHWTQVEHAARFNRLVCDFLLEEG
jgi:2-hydroxymuconate-semialdehyde hydrolase